MPLMDCSVSGIYHFFFYLFISHPHLSLHLQFFYFFLPLPELFLIFYFLFFISLSLSPFPNHLYFLSFHFYSLWLIKLKPAIFIITFHFIAFLSSPHYKYWINTHIHTSFWGREKSFKEIFIIFAHACYCYAPSKVWAEINIYALISINNNIV